MNQQVPPGGGGWGPPQGAPPGGQPQWGQTPPAAGQPPAQQMQGPPPSMPQPAGPTAPGYPPGYQAPSAGPQQPGFMHALSAPSGPAKVLWIGMVLMLVSFACKQILVDVSVQSIGGLIEVERLRSKERAEIAEVNAALDDVDNEIADIETTPLEPPTISDAPGAPPPDYTAFEAKKKERDEKLDKLKKKKSEIDKGLEPKRKKIRDEYRPKITEAERSLTQAAASGVGRIQTTLTLKLIVDLVKLIGATLVVLSALRMSVDPETSGGAKAYAAVIGGIAFISMVIGGIYAALFG